MKNYLFSKILLIFITLCSSAGGAAWGYEFRIEPNPVTQQSSNVFMGAGTWASNVDYLYPASLMQEYYVKEGIVKSIGFRIGRATNNPGQPARSPDLPENTVIRIYLANVDASYTALTENQPSTWYNWTLVFQYDNFTFTKYAEDEYGITTGYQANEWAHLKFNTGNTFTYTGGGLRMKICMERAERGATGRNAFIATAQLPARVWGNMAQTGVSPIDYCETQGLTNGYVHQSRYPWISLDIEMPEELYTLGGTTTTHQTFFPELNNRAFQYMGVLPSDVYFDETVGGSDNTIKYGTIKSLGFRIQNIWGEGINTAGRSLKIFMGLAPMGEPMDGIIAPDGSIYINFLNNNDPRAWPGWQLVYSRDDFSLTNLAADNGISGYNAGDWMDFRFNVSEFEYPLSAGNQHIMYYICSEGSASNGNFGPYNGMHVYGTSRPEYGSNQAYMTTTGNAGRGCESILVGGSAPSSRNGATNFNVGGFSNYIPDMRLSVSTSPITPLEFGSMEVTHPSLESTSPGAVSVPILHAAVQFKGTSGTAKFNGMSFTNKSIPNAVTKAKLYYTGTNDMLNLTDMIPVAEVDVTAESDTVTFTLPTPMDNMVLGQHHFWLTFDIAPNAPLVPDAIDATFNDITITLPVRSEIVTVPSTNTYVTTPDPEGALNVGLYVQIYCPPGVTNPLRTTGEYPVNPMSRNAGNVSRMQMTYLAEEMGGYPGLIDMIALYAQDVTAPFNSLQFDSVFILMRNSPKNSGNQNVRPHYFTEPPGVAGGPATGTAEQVFGGLIDEYLADGYTIVANAIKFPVVTTANTWVNMKLTTAFWYTGGDLDIIIHRTNLDSVYTNLGYNCAQEWFNAWREATYAGMGYQYASSGSLGTAGISNCNEFINSTTCRLNPYFPGMTLEYNAYRARKPNLRTSIQYFDGSKYWRSNAFSTEKQYVAIGAQADEVLGVMIETEGDVLAPFENMKQLTFNVKGSGSYANYAKLYYSGSEATFGSAVQYGEAIPIAASTGDITFEFENNELVLGHGQNYFWLAYEMNNNTANVGRTVDARYVGCTLTKHNPREDTWRDTTITESTLTPDPAGEKTIVGPLTKGTYYVGTSTPTRTADYATLSDFADIYSNYGTDRNTEVVIISDINDNKLARFNYNVQNKEHALAIKIDPAATSNYKLLTVVPGSAVIELLPGADNFSIDGGNANGARLTIEKGGLGGDVIKATRVNNLIIQNADLIGSTNGINLSAVNNFQLLNNAITRAGNYAINVEANSSIGSIMRNAVTGVGSGLALTGGSNTIKVAYNTFSNISSVSNSRAILIRGTADKYDLDIEIGNNAIGDVRSGNVYASAFELENARDVHIYHNTVIFSANRGAQRQTQIFHIQPASTVSLDVKNNLFVNNVVNAENLYSQHYYMTNPATFRLVAAGNLYSGAVFHRYGETANSYDPFETWQTSTGVDITSNHIFTAGNFVSPTDFHTDGAIVNAPEMIINTMADYEYSNADLDGSRGLFLTGQTTVGADEVLPVIKDAPTSADFPATLEICENSYQSIMLKVDRGFARYADNISRVYFPPATNVWITDQDDTLDNTNGINVTRHPYLIIERPNYTHTMRVKCISSIWQSEFETDYCDITVMKAPNLRTIPDVMLCYDAGRVEIETANALEGVAQSLQWQRKNGNTWDNIAGQTTSKLEIDFASDEESIAATSGVYRLQLTPYSVCNDIVGTAYSNEINVNIGYPLADNAIVNLISSLADVVKEEEGGEMVDVAKICVNNEIWLTAELAPNSTGSIMQYQWQKYNTVSNDWKPVESIINPSANSDTFRIYSVRSEHSGLYRCMVYGCSITDIAYTNTLRVYVEPASELLTQPNPITVSCVGRNLTNELSVVVTDPVNELSIRNTYQWFKDGKPFERFDQTGQLITPSHPLYATYRTDTTYLPFASLTTKDGGSYILRTIYINCAKEVDTLFSDTANLFVYSTANLLSQSNTVYAVYGGYSTLEMNMTDGAAISEDLGIQYTWYRKREIKDAAGAVTTTTDILSNGAKFSGATTGHLRINNILPTDINVTDATVIADYYYCEALEYCLQKTTTSSPMILKVAPELSLIEEPASVEVCQGATVTMTANAESTDNTQKIIYEWYKVGQITPILRGVDSRTLTLQNVATTDATDYYCVVSFEDYAGAKKQTATASVVINSAPTIIAEAYPDDIIAEGSAFELKVTTNDNGTYTYQWYLGAAPIAGATTASYSVAMATKANEGQYYVIVKNQCGEVQSTNMDIKIGVGIIENNDPAFRIISVSPNPVTHEAIISFVLPEANNAKLTLLDISGKEIVELYNNASNSGENTVAVSNKFGSVSSGAYLVVLESNGRKTSIKINISK